jgi:hypothetical protein
MRCILSLHQPEMYFNTGKNTHTSGSCNSSHHSKSSQPNGLRPPLSHSKALPGNPNSICCCNRLRMNTTTKANPKRPRNIPSPCPLRNSLTQAPVEHSMSSTTAEHSVFASATGAPQLLALEPSHHILQRAATPACAYCSGL